VEHHGLHRRRLGVRHLLKISMLIYPQILFTEPGSKGRAFKFGCSRNSLRIRGRKTDSI
jgi:hypothetical protein